MTTEVLPTLEEIFRGKLRIVVQSPDAELIESGLLDSLGLVELLLELERRFGVTFEVDDLDMENFRTLDRIAAFVTGRTGRGIHAA